MTTNNLSYETARKLREAGFPQKVWAASFVWDKEHWVVASALKEVELSSALVCPTLSEIIEELGENFTSLDRWEQNEKVHWQAEWKRLVFGHGSTPEQACADLYLALHNK